MELLHIPQLLFNDIKSADCHVCGRRAGFFYLTEIEFHNPKTFKCNGCGAVWDIAVDSGMAERKEEALRKLDVAKAAVIEAREALISIGLREIK